MRKTNAAFTLLELLSAVVVLAILGTLCFPLVQGFRERADAVKCTANLQALGQGVSAFMEEKRIWPQIPPESLGSQNLTESSQTNSSAARWIAALKPYGIPEAAWRCPSIDRQIAEKGTENALKSTRIDYTPTCFDDKPESPRRWPKHPWFIERGAGHGHGPHILLTDGSVVTMEDLFRSPP